MTQQDKLNAIRAARETTLVIQGRTNRTGWPIDCEHARMLAKAGVGYWDYSSKSGHLEIRIVSTK